MNILLIGDVVGSPGRAIMKKALPVVFKKYDVDYCVANVENAAGGFGVTKEVCDEILDMGVDCLTSGQPHLGQEGDHGGHRPHPPAAAPAQLPGAPAGPRLPRREGQALEGARRHLEPQRPGVHERGDGRPVRARPEGGRAPARGGEGHPRGHARGGELREDGDRELLRRPGERGGRHPHPRAHLRPPDPAPGDRLLHRPRHDRPLRLDHRGRERRGDPPIPHRHAQPLRDGQGRPALRGGGRGRGRADGPGPRRSTGCS